MKRSAGVTIIAVLSLIGSGLFLLLGVSILVFAAIGPLLTSQQTSGAPAPTRALLVVAAAVYFVPAAWGIVTSIGLFRLSNWARISTIIFSVFLIVSGSFVGLTPLVAPLPPNGQDYESFARGMKIITGSVGAALLALGIWWLVYFTRAHVREQFVGSLAMTVSPSTALPLTGVSQGAFAAMPERPLSLTVIGWFLLAGCLFVPLTFLHFPAVFFTTMLTGWSATLFYIVVFACNFYVGFGLLRYKPFAREIGIGYFVFTFLNSAIFYLAPGGRTRIRALMDLQPMIFPWLRHPESPSISQMDTTPMALLGGLSGLVFIVVQLYFLITRKRAYEAAARAANAPSLAS